MKLPRLLKARSARCCRLLLTATLLLGMYIVPATGHAQAIEVIVKEKDDPHVELGGTPGYFYDAPAGSVVSNGHAMWTGSNTSSPDNFVKWKPPLPECGSYEVFAYVAWIENGKLDTTNAVYKIRHRNGETTRAVNMREVNDGFGRTRTDRWTSLGTYVFSKDANTADEYVLLGDTTGENGIQSVNFDDMRWIMRAGGGPACAGIDPPRVDGIVVKDRDDPNVERGGTPEYLYDAPAGSVVAGNHATWTGSNANSPDNYIKWKPPLDRCGLWEVFAYVAWIENGKLDTTNAVYKIRHRNAGTPAGIEEVRAVNMEQVNRNFGSARADRWVSLGTHLWSAGANSAGEYVLLGDSTGESVIRSINFDDMRWVYSGPNDAACNAAPDRSAPGGRITSPQNNATTGPASINFAAEAWDNQGGSGVNRVDFHVYYDNTWHFAGSDNTAPYSIGFGTPSGAPSQQLRFTIHVYDNAGNRTTDPGGWHYVNYQAPAPAAKKVAVLVHGWQGITFDYRKFSCAQGAYRSGSDKQDYNFGVVSDELERHGYSIWYAHWDTGLQTPNLGSASNCLKKQLADIRKEEGGVAKVTVIAHSMGGVVSRAYIEGKHYAGDVQQLITFGSPHTGVHGEMYLTALGFGANCILNPGVCYVSAPWMKWFNLTHGPSTMRYDLVGADGSAGKSANNWAAAMRAGLRITDGPNDSFVGLASATGYYYTGVLGSLPFRSVRNTQTYSWKTGAFHSSGLGSPEFFADEQTWKCLREFLNIPMSPRGCAASGRVGALAVAQQAGVEPSYTQVFRAELARGESRTVPLRLDGSAAQIILNHSRGDLDFSLTAPDGTVVSGKDAAQLLQAGSFEQYPAAAFPPLAVYSMDNPAVGEWKATVTATNVVTSTEIALYGVLASPTRLEVSAPPSVAIGAALRVEARLSDTAATVGGAAVQAAVATAGGTTYTTLRQTEPGLYAGELVAPAQPGPYQLSVRASGPADRPFTRQQDLVFFVRTDDMLLDGGATIDAIDDNANGRYDRLRVTVPLRVKAAQGFLISAVLRAADGEIVTQTNLQPSLAGGAQQLALEFDGKAIGMANKAGPFTVELNVMSADQLMIAVDENRLASTIAYAPGQFEVGAALRLYVPLAAR